MSRGAGSKSSAAAGTAQGVVVVLAGFLPILAIVALSPAVPSLVQHFRAVPNASTLVPLAVTAPGLMIALFSPAMGWATDRFGRRTLLLAATLLYGFLGVAPFFLDSLTGVIASRLALGLTEAAILTVTNTLIGDYFAHDRRRAWLSAQGLIGPVFGTSVVALSGFVTAASWNASFLIYAVAFPIFVAMLAFIYEPPRSARARRGSGEGSPFPWRSVVVTGLVTLFTASLYYVYIVQVGLAFQAVGIADPGRIGLLISVASIGVFLGAILFQLLSARLSAARQILCYLSLLGIGLAGIGSVRTPGAMTAFAFVQQLGAGIAIPALVLWAVSLLPAEHRGRGMGIWTACFFLGQFTSPFLVALARGFAGTIQGAFLALGVVALAGAAAAGTVALRAVGASR